MSDPSSAASRAPSRSRSQSVAPGRRQSSGVWRRGVRDCEADYVTVKTGMRAGKIWMAAVTLRMVVDDDRSPRYQDEVLKSVVTFG